MKKSIIRDNAKKRRLALDKNLFWEYQDLILQQIKSFNWESVNYLHLFLPIKHHKEIDTFEIIDFFKHSYPHINLVISKCNFQDKSLTHWLFDPTHTVLIKNQYGIPEPLYGEEIKPYQIDAIFVPLLSFDRMGHRVGYGAGFYDRFLAECRENVLKIGLSLFEAEENPLPNAPHDIKLSHCISPQQVYTF